MRNPLAGLQEYYRELAGESPQIVADDRARTRLPMFLGQLYDAYSAQLFDGHWTLLVLKGRENPTPAEVASHARMAAGGLKGDFAFVFAALASFERNRLVKKRVPFIVPGRQMFLPGHLIDLRERHSGSKPGVPTKLSMPAQLLVLFQIEKRVETNPMALKDWAQALGYSRMSLTRTCQELEEAELAERVDKGKSVWMSLLQGRRHLWEQAKPRLISPVLKRGYFRLTGENRPAMFEAGLSALAQFSDLTSGNQNVLAMQSALFWKAKQNRVIEEVPLPEDTALLIERWRYDPAILSDDRRTVDRLSLYLSLQDDPNERVQSALQTLLEGVKW